MAADTKVQVTQLFAELESAVDDAASKEKALAAAEQRRDQCQKDYDAALLVARAAQQAVQERVSTLLPMTGRVRQGG